MSGGAGADVFVFTPTATAEIDKVLGFDDGLDILRMKGVADGFSALALSEVTDANGDWVVVEHAGLGIWLRGVDIADIGADDFDFV